jgi:hypothetical protein
MSQKVEKSVVLISDLECDKNVKKSPTAL